MPEHLGDPCQATPLAKTDRRRGSAHPNSNPDFSGLGLSSSQPWHSEYASEIWCASAPHASSRLNWFGGTQRDTNSADQTGPDGLNGRERPTRRTQTVRMDSPDRNLGTLNPQVPGSSPGGRTRKPQVRAGPWWPALCVPGSQCTPNARLGQLGEVVRYVFVVRSNPCMGMSDN